MIQLNILILCFLLAGFVYAGVSEDQTTKGFYLKQVDLRKRTSVSLGIPGMVRLRLRPSYEYRYSVKKQLIPVGSEKKADQTAEKSLGRTAGELPF